MQAKQQREIHIFDWKRTLSWFFRWYIGFSWNQFSIFSKATANLSQSPAASLSRDYKIRSHWVFSCDTASLPPSQHLHVTSHCTAGICCLLCRRARRTLSDVNCQGLVLVWTRGMGSLFILPHPCPCTSDGYLMPTSSRDEAAVFSRWRDVCQNPWTLPVAFDWQALPQRMRSGGSRAAKRIY